MANKKANSNLRRELEALRTQAQAYGISNKKNHISRVSAEDNKALSEDYDSEKYEYVKNDLRRSFIFVGLSVVIILLLGVLISDFSIAANIRNSLHLHQLVF